MAIPLLLSHYQEVGIILNLAVSLSLLAVTKEAPKGNALRIECTLLLPQGNTAASVNILYAPRAFLSLRQYPPVSKLDPIFLTITEWY